MTERKAPSVGKVSHDPYVKKLSGGSENLEKALDDMLSNTGPCLRSDSSKKDKDTEMPPPNDHKGKMKKMARKKRLEKLLEAKNRQNKNKK